MGNPVCIQLAVILDQSAIYFYNPKRVLPNARQLNVFKMGAYIIGFSELLSNYSNLSICLMRKITNLQGKLQGFFSMAKVKQLLFYNSTDTKVHAQSYRNCSLLENRFLVELDRFQLNLRYPVPLPSSGSDLFLRNCNYSFLGNLNYLFFIHK